MVKQPLLSIGMIVKNEIRCLEKCLKALQPLRDAIACELVIADTGSTDGTRQVAEKYADILFDFEWINDFAAARNAVLEKCTGKWYLTVDADEYLQPDVSELVEFLAGPEAERVDYCMVVQRNHKVPEMNGIYSDFPAPRMARMTPQLYYHGSIHESFLFYTSSVIGTLNKTIFDHDGYAYVSPEKSKRKAERNLTLLEAELERAPKSYRRILQCLETASPFKKKWRTFAYRGMELIMEKDGSHDEWRTWAPAIARQAVLCALGESLPEAETWILWARETFPDSIYVQVDINYKYIQYLHGKEHCSEELEVGRDYFKGLRRYAEIGCSVPELRVSPVFYAHPHRETQVRLWIADAMREDGRERQSLDMLGKVDFETIPDDLFVQWLTELEKNGPSPATAKLVQKKLEPIFEKRDTGTKDDMRLWKLLNAHLLQVFSPEGKDETTPWKLYRDFSGTIGLCAKLAEADGKAETEELLSQVTEWDDFLPLALVRVMAMGISLPDAFFGMEPEQLHALETALLTVDPDAVGHIVDYTAPELVTDWRRLCFAYDLLAALWMHTEEWDDEHKDLLSNRFAQVGAVFLQECYNPDLLASEEYVGRLSPLHRFTWHFVRAVELREEGDWVGYVRTLRTALKQSYSMKPLIQYLLDHVTEQQEQTEHIASASPELLALAEQVRALLAAYPADDPAVIQLKQTPAYQKVAFLIEEPQGIVQ